jgi:hypothetical protein
MAMKKYTLVFQTWGAAQQIDLEGCNSVTFYNTGTATAYIEQTPIPPGGSIPVLGNDCEITNDVLQLTFDTTAGLIQSMTIIKKSYVNS